jgi:hypothetical protein
MKLRTPLAVLVALALAFFAIQPTLHAENPVSGAVFTSDSTCSGVDLNIYGTQDEVYVDGGPAHPGAAGLPDGTYYIRVTEPDGTLLGTSIGTGNDQPIIVSGGEFANCYQLSSILKKASDGSPGYDTTTNPGGEYKVWISNDPNFLNNSTKTDNFKVKVGGGSGGDRISITVEKFYDANANGVKDGSEPFLNNWKVQLTIGSSDYIRFTPVVFVTSPEDYSVIEFMPIETNWVRTTQTAAGSYPVLKTVNTTGWLDTQFGNVCLGGGGGFTLGFWSNKNGQALVGADDLALLSRVSISSMRMARVSIPLPTRRSVHGY